MTISIIIPAYNVQNSIHVTLKSLLAQNDKDFEIIIVNDGSTDETAKVVEEFLESRSFVDYKIINKTNGGVSSARNRGIIEAKGDYIYFLDGDDYISPEFISCIKQYVNLENPDIIAWGYNNVKEDGSIIFSYFNRYSSNLSRMTGAEALRNILIEKTFRVWTCSILYKKQLIDDNKLWFTEGCINGEDQEFAFKALANAKEVEFIDQTLSFYVQREGSISNSYNVGKFDAIGAMERAAEYIKTTLGNEANDISHIVKFDKTIEPFIDNYIDYYNYKLKDDASFQSFNTLESEVEKKYPGLIKKTKNKMKSGKNINPRNRIRYLIFLFSPYLYIKLKKFIKR